MFETICKPFIKILSATMRNSVFQTTAAASCARRPRCGPPLSTWLDCRPEKYSRHHRPQILCMRENTLDHRRKLLCLLSPVVHPILVQMWVVYGEKPVGVQRTLAGKAPPKSELRSRRSDGTGASQTVPPRPK